MLFSEETMFRAPLPVVIVLGGVLVATGVLFAGRQNQLLPKPSPVQEQGIPFVAPSSALYDGPLLQPTPEPAVRAASGEKDPIVDCQFPHSGPIPMRESKCAKMTDCEVESGKWQAVWVTDCERLYGKLAAPSATPERKRVLFHVTEAHTSGIHSCYEDRVNELTRFESRLKTQQPIIGTCMFDADMEAKRCTESNRCAFSPTVDDVASCIKQCYEKAQAGCLAKASEFGKEREKYTKLVYEVCP
ncbi:MAG: hypothetical protein G01um101438_458 [Parcubacteria group bacterium Gr01-1014_38]|nr:MAG: hypothetical protein G01um101438_458 [Parcubacteria group bacterium Gr01-1014_38]